MTRANHDAHYVFVDTYSEGQLLVVSSIHRIGCREDRSSGIQGSLDASLGNGDCLLLHGLVDSNLILQIHLVKLIDSTDTLYKNKSISEERPALNTANCELMPILHHVRYQRA